VSSKIQPQPIRVTVPGVQPTRGAPLPVSQPGEPRKPGAAPPLTIECFGTVSRPPELAPGKPNRLWMDRFSERHPYRCLPLTMANTTGWEMLCPFAFTAEWNGGPLQHDITIRPDKPGPEHDFVTSHFAHGVLTFHPGYLFRTPPGWSMWAMGPPNHIKDGIQALVGMIETDWLPFPFTMNWLFTRPGRVRFEKGEPFCFITLQRDKEVAEFEPVLRSMESDVAFREQYEAWYRQRETFNAGILRGDPSKQKEAWQRFYFKGELPENTGEPPKDHVNKRRMKRPRLGR
jgi:hypothetical protein